MTDSGLVLVDTNVLLDIAGQDEVWYDWSQEQMSRHVGRMVVNPIITRDVARYRTYFPNMRLICP